MPNTIKLIQLSDTDFFRDPHMVRTTNTGINERTLLCQSEMDHSKSDDKKTYGYSHQIINDCLKNICYHEYGYVFNEMQLLEVLKNYKTKVTVWMDDGIWYIAHNGG